MATNCWRDASLLPGYIRVALEQGTFPIPQLKWSNTVSLCHLSLHACMLSCSVCRVQHKYTAILYRADKNKLGQWDTYAALPHTKSIHVRKSKTDASVNQVTLFLAGVFPLFDLSPHQSCHLVIKSVKRQNPIDAHTWTTTAGLSSQHVEWEHVYLDVATSR